MEQGLAILRTPKRYLQTVVSYQAGGWVCRAATAYFMLEAFHIHASVRNALLIMVVQAVATVMPFTPGGVGPKQALLVVLLAGQAPRPDILALSVGMEVAIILTNVAVGAASLTVIFKGSGGIRGAIAEARARKAAPAAADGAPSPRPPPPLPPPPPRARRPPADTRIASRGDHPHGPPRRPPRAPASR